LIIKRVFLDVLISFGRQKSDVMSSGEIASLQLGPTVLV